MTRLLLLTALLAGPALAQHDASVIPDDAPEWLSLSDAIAAAQTEDKLLLVYGYAAWCGFCVRFDNETFTDDDVQAYLAEHYAPVRLDIEADSTLRFFDAAVTGAQLGRAMGISGTPTNVFVDADGALITKFPGWTDPETFLHALRYVREEAYETTPFDAYLEQQRTGLDLSPRTDELRAPRAPAGSGD